jgi:uncharacterized protein (DUF4415 family)
MAKRKLLKEFVPGRGYSREDWDEVSDNPEWTEEDLKQARPFSEVFPDLAESITRSRGRPPIETPKKQITLRLDQDVIEKFRGTGRG